MWIGLVVVAIALYTTVSDVVSGNTSISYQWSEVRCFIITCLAVILHHRRLWNCQFAPRKYEQVCCLSQF